MAQTHDMNANHVPADVASRTGNASTPENKTGRWRGQGSPRLRGKSLPNDCRVGRVGYLWLAGGQGTCQPILEEGRNVVGVGWVGWRNL